MGNLVRLPLVGNKWEKDCLEEDVGSSRQRKRSSTGQYKNNHLVSITLGMTSYNPRAVLPLSFDLFAKRVFLIVLRHHHKSFISKGR
jgi:hypothetical protein